MENHATKGLPSTIQGLLLRFKNYKQLRTQPAAGCQSLTREVADTITTDPG